jgi:hypothetical protein
MNARAISLRFLLCALCLACALAPRPADGATENAPGRVIHVRPGLDKAASDNAMRSINAALAIAKPGDTLRIAPGVYRERLRVPTPGLRIIGEGGTPQQPAVILAPPAGKSAAPLVEDSHNTLWSGIGFAGDGGALLQLRGFTGLFSRCRFNLSQPSTFVRIYGGTPEFLACVFLGSPKEASTVEIFGENGKPGKVAFAYTLFQDFGAGALMLRGDQDVSAVNCLFANCGHFHIREEGVASTVEALNSVFYLVASPQLVRQDPLAPKTRLDTCLYTPAPTDNFHWRSRPLEAQQEIDSVNCLTASPRFQGGRLVFLNLCIDDSQNLPLWSRLAEKLNRLSLPMSIALNTGAMHEEAWRQAAQRVKEGHEVATHNTSHSSMLARDAIRMAYQGKARSAEATINKNKQFTLTVDGRHLLNLDLGADDTLTLGRLVEVLEGMGVRAELSAASVRDVPAVFLAETWRQDILFPLYTTAFVLDHEAYLGHILSKPRIAVETHLRRLGVENWQCLAAVSPFGEFSDNLVAAVEKAGYVLARGNNSLHAGNRFDRVNVKPLQDVSANKILRDPPLDKLEEVLRVFLDTLQYHGGAIGFYSHGEDEMKEGDWELLFSLLEKESAIKPMRLVDIAAALERHCKPVGPGLFACPAGEYPAVGGVDFVPEEDSPLRGAGKPTPYRSNFAGEPVPEGTAPNIGLY